MTRKIDGQLEIDNERGVIYFHSAKAGRSVLRIQGLPVPIPEDELLDLAGPMHISWKAGKKG